MPKLIEEKILESNSHFRTYLRNPILQSFYMQPTDEEEIESKIKSFKNNKANGPYSIPTRVFKDCKKQLSKPLSLIINQSFETGIFPTDLKTANVVLVHKGGDKSDCNNYRPIALL